MKSYFEGRDDPYIAGWEIYLNGFCNECLNCGKAFEVEEGIPYDCFSEIDFCSDNPDTAVEFHPLRNVKMNIYILRWIL